MTELCDSETVELWIDLCSYPHLPNVEMAGEEESWAPLPRPNPP